MDLLFLDTETTDLEEPRLIQLAWKRNSICFEELYEPPKPIEISAMAIHHITNEMLTGKSTFDASPTSQVLRKMLQETILVAHNAKFDMGVLRNEGVLTSVFICTKKIALSLFPDLEQHKLQYLRYLWSLKFDKEITAHDALSDVLVLEGVFKYMYDYMLARGEADPIQKMIKISIEPTLLSKLNFGKYRGENFKEIQKRDRGYLKWLRDQDFVRKDEDLYHTVRYYLGEK